MDAGSRTKVAARHERLRELAQGRVHPSTLETIHYQGKYFASAGDGLGLHLLPRHKVKSGPHDLQQLYSDAKANGGIVYQAPRTRA